MKKFAIPLAMFPVLVCAGILLYLSASRNNTHGKTFTVVTDQIGREVRIPKKPDRIVSLMPNNTEILFAIGAGPQVVGVSKNCNYPAEAQALPHVAEFTLNGANLELIVASKPDLVVASGEWMRPTIDALEQLGIPVVAVDPKTLDEVAKAIDLIGQATGHTEEAVVLSTKFRNDLAERQARIDRTPSTLSVVYVLAADQTVMLAGRGTFIGEIITLAGGKHVFPELKQDYPRISDEELLKRGVDVILCPDHAGEDVTTQLKKRTGWGNLAAIKNNRIYIVADDLMTRPGPRLIEGLAEIERHLNAK